MSLVRCGAKVKRAITHNDAHEMDAHEMNADLVLSPKQDLGQRNNQTQLSYPSLQILSFILKIPTK